MQRHLLFFPALKKSLQMTPHFINSLFIMYMLSDSQTDTLLLISELQIHAPDPR